MNTTTTAVTRQAQAGLVTVNEGEVRAHLAQIVTGAVEETLNQLLDAEADALCHFRHENRDFTINRIRAHALAGHLSAAQPGDDSWQLGLRFANISDDPVTVSIWFDKATARRIRERIWHPSQQITVGEDGSCVLTMAVTGLDTITRWRLSFGQHAMPLSPKRFVNKVQKAVKAVAIAYQIQQD